MYLRHTTYTIYIHIVYYIVYTLYVFIYLFICIRYTLHTLYKYINIIHTLKVQYFFHFNHKRSQPRQEDTHPHTGVATATPKQGRVRPLGRIALGVC